VLTVDINLLKSIYEEYLINSCVINFIATCHRYISTANGVIVEVGMFLDF